MTQQENYCAAIKELLAKASEELAQGDTRQASEKGWGAAAQMIKAVAEQRGLPHNGHALLFRVVGELVEETGDRQLSNLFNVANSLHSNFYENWLPPEIVRISLEDVQLLLEKLEPMLT